MATNKNRELELNTAPKTTSTNPAPAATATGSQTGERSWGQKLDDTMAAIENRTPFSYDLNGDALYQQYKDRYIQGGKMAMMDTMGQAQAMTGGYGNSYAQSAGQQAYQGYLQGLNDIVPELYSMAYQKYADEGADLYNQAQMYADREEQEFQRSQIDLDRQAQSRSDIIAFIEATGQMPTAEQLAAAGLSEAEAQAYVNAWKAQNPDLAYRTGAMTAEEYKLMTGKYPPGYNAGGGGGGTPTGLTLFQIAQADINRGLSSEMDINKASEMNREILGNDDLTPEEKAALIVGKGPDGWSNDDNRKGGK